MVRPNRDTARALRGARVLVVEDNFLILLELDSILKDACADRVHCCRGVSDAGRCAAGERLDAAILDVRLGSDLVKPVAQRLAAGAVPMLFYT